MNHRWIMLWSSALGGSGVAAGAFGAHGLKNSLSASRLEVWEIAVRYQLLHAVVLLTLFVLLQQWSHRLICRSALLLVAGSVCFSGSLYLLALTGMQIFGPVTPLGGLLLIAGWLTLFYAGIRTRNAS